MPCIIETEPTPVEETMRAVREVLEAGRAAVREENPDSDHNVAGDWGALQGDFAAFDLAAILVDLSNRYAASALHTAFLTAISVWVTGGDEGVESVIRRAHLCIQAAYLEHRGEEYRSEAIALGQVFASARANYLAVEATGRLHGVGDTGRGEA